MVIKIKSDEHGDELKAYHDGELVGTSSEVTDLPSGHPSGAVSTIGRLGLTKENSDNVKQALKDAHEKAFPSEKEVLRQHALVSDARTKSSQLYDAHQRSMSSEDTARSDRLRSQMQHAQDQYEKIASENPAGHAYDKAMDYRFSSNDMKSTAGRRAMSRIARGDNPASAIADMKNEWTNSARNVID